jgi:hypothetical protein
MVEASGDFGQTVIISEVTDTKRYFVHVMINNLAVMTLYTNIVLYYIHPIDLPISHDGVFVNLFGTSFGYFTRQDNRNQNFPS